MLSGIGPDLCTRARGIEVVAALVGASAVDLPVRGDVELAEDLAQEPLDGARAGLRSRVREALADEPRDLGLLGGEIAALSRGCVCGGLAGARSSRAARWANALAHRGEHLVAVRSCSRASSRRHSRRSHSRRAPHECGCGRAGRSPRDRRSRPLWLSRARERASMPSAQSVPLTRVSSVRRWRTSPARSACPHPMGASTSVTSVPQVGARARRALVLRTARPGVAHRVPARGARPVRSVLPAGGRATRVRSAQPPVPLMVLLAGDHRRTLPSR